MKITAFDVDRGYRLTTGIALGTTMTAGDPAFYLLNGSNTTRPAAGDVLPGTLFADPALRIIYQSDGTTWGTWADMNGGGDTSGQIAAGWMNTPFALNAGISVDVVAPYSGTITGWTILADATASADIAIGKCTYAGFGAFASIVAAAPPTLSGAVKATSTSVGTWTIAVTAGDVLRFTLSSVSGATRLLLVLAYSRP